MTFKLKWPWVVMDDALLFFLESDGTLLAAIALELLHILVPFEGAGERFDNSQMKHLPDEGEGAGLAGGLLVAPRFPSR